jgi:hypothetical protein
MLSAVALQGDLPRPDARPIEKLLDRRALRRVEGSGGTGPGQVPPAWRVARPVSH